MMAKIRFMCSSGPRVALKRVLGKKGVYGHHVQGAEGAEASFVKYARLTRLANILGDAANERWGSQ